jgi:hypothetical protein
MTTALNWSPKSIFAAKRYKNTEGSRRLTDRFPPRIAGSVSDNNFVSLLRGHKKNKIWNSENGTEYEPKWVINTSSTHQQINTRRINTSIHTRHQQINTLSGGRSLPGSLGKSTCAIACFCSSCIDTFHYSTKKKTTFDRRFRMCERVVHVVEMASIVADCSHHQAKN